MANLEWSDDEEDNINPQPDRMFPPSDSESDEEYDYSELNKLILNKVNPNTYELNNCKSNNCEIQEASKVKKQRKREPKNNKVIINWNELTKTETKEKKWMSKRMEERKQQEGKIKNIRQFNPRLPIPNKKNVNKNIKIKENFNSNDFPEL